MSLCLYCSLISLCCVPSSTPLHKCGSRREMCIVKFMPVRVLFLGLLLTVLQAAWNFCLLFAHSYSWILRSVTWQESEGPIYSFIVILKADSHIACRAHAAPMPCRWGFRMCLSHLIYTVRPCLIHTCHSMPMPHPCHALTMLPFSRRRHSTSFERRPVGYRPRSASSGYHAAFHEDCYQKHTNPPHNDPYLRMWRVVVAHYKTTIC